MTSPVVTVYLLDDHELIRRGIRQLLDNEPDLQVVGDAGTAGRAVTELGRLRPDVAVLDVRLPDGSGIDVCHDLRVLSPRTRCLMLTSFDDDEALFAALRAGAAGFMNKADDGPTLVQNVRAVAAGRPVIEPTAAARVFARMAQPDRRPDVADATPPELARLSPTERRILALIAEGLTNRQIGERIFLAEKTVKNHVTSILAKLGLRRRTEAAVLADRLLATRPVRP